MGNSIGPKAVKDIYFNIKVVPLLITLWPYFISILHRSNICSNDEVMSSLHDWDVNPQNQTKQNHKPTLALCNKLKGYPELVLAQYFMKIPHSLNFYEKFLAAIENFSMFP